MLAVIRSQVVAGEVGKLDAADGFAGFVARAGGAGGLGADVGGRGGDDAGSGGGSGGGGGADARSWGWATGGRVGGQAVGFAAFAAGAGVCAVGGDVLAESFEFAAGWGGVAGFFVAVGDLEFAFAVGFLAAVLVVEFGDGLGAVAANAVFGGWSRGSGCALGSCRSGAYSQSC